MGFVDWRHLGNDRRILKHPWHRSIGHDTFWTPPHIAIYLCCMIEEFGRHT
jgi:hypothetical protein